jgi:putative lipoprotein
MLDPYRRAEISGNTTYRERMTAPSGSIVIVQLQDISRMDAPARTIAEQRIPLDGRSVPVDYRLNPLTSELRPNMRCGVRSEVRGPGGALLWTSDTVNPVNPTVMWQSLPMIEMVKVGRQHPRLLWYANNDILDPLR